MMFSGNSFLFLIFFSFCFVVAICNLVHDVEVIFHFPLLLTT